MVEDPWSGKPVCLIPAAQPDVAMFHVPRCDMYGNAQIDGIIVEDFELARAARRVIITTEEIVEEEVIRNQPCRTVIPFYVVDAVCEVPHGAHPTLMPYLYFFDEEHIGEWLDRSQTPEGTAAYFEKYVYGVEDFDEYLELAGGIKQLNYLKQVEQLQRADARAVVEGKEIANQRIIYCLRLHTAVLCHSRVLSCACEVQSVNAQVLCIFGLDARYAQCASAASRRARRRRSGMTIAVTASPAKAQIVPAPSIRWEAMHGSYNNSTPRPNC